MKPKTYYKLGIQHGVSQCLHAFCEHCFEGKSGQCYDFELELWEAECLAVFHIACSEFIST